MFKYIIFGLKVLSEISLNCYQEEFDIEDVNILFDYTIEGYDEDYHFVRTDGNISFLNMPKGGIYKVSEGSEIRISPCQLADDRLIKHFLLAQCFATLLIQRKMFPLHGAILDKNNVSIAIIGESGAGKTSLSTGLILNGWKMVTDDIIGITFENGEVFAEASYPYKKIWKSTADKLGLEVDKTKGIFNRVDKYYYDNPDFFTQKRSSLKYIFEIKKSETKRVKSSHMENASFLPILIKNSYRYHIVRDSNQLLDHMRFMSYLCGIVSGYVVERPLNDFTVSEQVKLVEDILERNNG